MSWTFGRAQSPMQAMLEFPDRSSWDAPSMACRRPAHTVSNTVRKGNHPSITFSSSGASRRSGLATRYDSPSVTRRSGSNVALASRAPMLGILPNALARISPSPRHASAHATTQTSATSTSAATRALSLTIRSHGSLVLLLVHVEVAGAERIPRARVRRRPRVVPLERLVPVVVGLAGGEVRAAGGLDDAVGHRPVDAQRPDRPLLRQVLGRNDPFAGHEAAPGRAKEHVVEVQVRPEHLPGAGGVSPVHVHDGDV